MDREGAEDVDRNAETQAIAISEENKNSSAEQELEIEVLLPSKAPPDLVRALEIVEKDAYEVAGSLTSIMSSLRLALSQVTGSSLEHMRCYNDVAGQVQESALDAASKGNRFINACMRLNEEMKGMGSLAAQLKLLKRTADNLDSLVTRYLPRT